MNNLVFKNTCGNSHPQRPLKNKINIKQLKNNTLNSLNEVEHFLRDFNKFKNYIKLYKILK